MTPRSILSSFLSVLVGAVFVFSALSKIPTLEQFGWTVVETTFLNWTAAEWFARILIGLELFLGLLFLAHVRVKKIAIPLSLAVLVVFTIYLLLVIAKQGNEGNCGCFGEIIAMTPLQSVYKNVVLIALIILLAIRHREWTFPYLKLSLALALAACMAVPIIINPPESIYIYEPRPDLNQPIPLSILYQSDKNPAPATELRKGKHIISFMSLTCEYCRKAAKRMRIMKEKHPELPFYVVLNGDSSHLDDFFKDTRMYNIEHSMFNGAEEFAKMNGSYSFPSIKWVNDTTLIRESNYLTLDEQEVLDWIKQ